MCTNDHLFLCPRHLCRAYYELLEIFESPLCAAPRFASAGGAAGGRDGAGASYGAAYITRGCRRGAPLRPYLLNETATRRPDAAWRRDWEATEAANPPLIFATRQGDASGGDLQMNGPPARAYTIPYVPPRLAPRAEYYVLARYTAAGTQCVASDPQVTDECCGLIRELPIYYTVARGSGSHGRLLCAFSLNASWRHAPTGVEHAAAMAAARERCARLDAAYAPARARLKLKKSGSFFAL